MFAYASLDGRGFAQAVATTEFAVVDLETTGFSPEHGDRIVEVAVVRMRGDGSVAEEWSTLVDPGRPVAATAVHRIRAEDVVGAPGFVEIVGDLLRLFDGAVVVAHHAAFEERFLVAEFARSGITLPRLPAVCTMQLARDLQLPLRNHKLATCCAHFGIVIDGAHAALADARATGRLLLRELTAGGVRELVHAVPVAASLPQLLPYGGTLRARVM